MTKTEIHELLKSVGYSSNDEIDYTLLTVMATERPLLIEGAPGVGKTSLAKAVADGLHIPLIRVQMYDGLTDDRILYDYNYQKQLLTLEAIKPALEKETQDMSLNETIHHVANKLDFYGKDFLIERPILRTINGDGRKVLLLDELDKAPEEIEYMLYEFLEDFTITIPQYGTIRCPEDQRPIVFVTSNCYRDLSGAFKRRCLYLYIDQKTQNEMIEILKVRANVDDKLAQGIAACLFEAQRASLHQTPSISEGIEWARFLSNQKITKVLVLNTLGMLIKNQKDKDTIRKIVDRCGELIWKDIA